MDVRVDGQVIGEIPGNFAKGTIYKFTLGRCKGQRTDLDSRVNAELISMKVEETVDGQLALVADPYPIEQFRRIWGFREDRVPVPGWTH